MRVSIFRGMFRCGAIVGCVTALPFGQARAAEVSEAAFGPGSRVLLDAHNCYPYGDRWHDRIDRAIATGYPLAIEQDLVWYSDEATGGYRSIVSHGKPYTGQEPTLRDYFFERLRGDIERELASGDRSRWPVVTLNLDFKDDGLAHLKEIWDLLGEYESWICTAERTETPETRAPLDVKPILVLTGSSDRQEKMFHEMVPVGARLRLFGAVRTKSIDGGGATSRERNRAQASAPPDQILTSPATNYRRWWNNSWYVIEEGGARGGEDWTPAEAARLRAFADHAHAQGCWLRFYTLNGHAASDGRGWSPGYNFGSREAAETRWRACIDAGVDFVATDMYEDFASVLRP